MAELWKRRPLLKKACLYTILIALLLGPRLLRIAYPYLWVEDDVYWNNAFLILEGQKPYEDFIQPHFPALEYLLAVFFALFKPTFLTAEVLTAAAVAAMALLLFMVVKEEGSWLKALLTVFFLSTSQLFFRYHIFQLEIFEALLVVVMFYLIKRDISGKGQIFIVLLMALGFSMKASFVLIQASFIMLLLFERETRKAVNTLLLLLAADAGILVLYFLLFGDEFVIQALFFQFVKGTNLYGFERAPYFFHYGLDLGIWIGALGFIQSAIKRPKGHGFFLLLTFSYLIFFGPLFDTFWLHNLLPIVPCMAFFASSAVVDLFQRLKGLKRPISKGILLTTVEAIYILLGLFYFTLWKDYPPGNLYGFGFMPEEEVREVVGFIKGNTIPSEKVLVPDFFAMESQRQNIFNCIEARGVYLWLKEGLKENRLLELRDHARGRTFQQMVEETKHYWLDELKESMSHGQPRLLVTSKKPSLSYPYLEPATLKEKGYTMAMKSKFFYGWLWSSFGGSAPKGK